MNALLRSRICNQLAIHHPGSLNYGIFILFQAWKGGNRPGSRERVRSAVAYWPPKSNPMHGLFHEFVSNASSMARNHFIMRHLAHCKLRTVGIVHDPVKNGPTRGPSFHTLWRSCREIPDKCTVFFTNLYRMLHQWLGAAST